ncbi:amino acid ABC transporter permease, partial [Rhizobium ruizarguesonis]
MLLHGIEMTLIIYAGSWTMAMALAILLLALRLSPFRFGDPLVAAYVS